MPPLGGMPAGYGPDRPSVPEERERGYRRRKLAAMAGNLYRTGQQAVTELREQYAQTRAAGDGVNNGHTRIHIPGAFPDVAITVQGDDQMVLFPSYAKRHTKGNWDQMDQQLSQETQGSIKDEEYWRQEWERMEDEKAIVDVDVRGWIYSPHTGPMTRRNRVLIGLARQLSGVPAPRADQGYSSGAGSLQTPHQMHEEAREQEKIAHEAARIERQGQAEKRVAYQGGYSEKPQDGYDIETESIYRPKSRNEGTTPDSPPGSPYIPPRTNSTNTTSTNELTEAELAVANANLMARIAPFMTNPLVALPITLFFYNDTKSQSRTVITNDAGHFIIRAALDFIPTHVRVLATEDLSATQEIEVVEPQGVSLISDIDDTVKRSNISGGAKEIFRNTFVRDLSDLTIDGVREWYSRMHRLGVMFHYCSNSPWQLFPVLASFFKMVGLPPGSLHLKQYSGMLQGIFEPVAERKKSTLNRLLKDFPDRQFLLVGDSGEADLEVYTELVMQNPRRILAVFIRDVTTPEETKFFDPGFDPIRRKASITTLNDGSRSSRPGLAIRQNSAPGAASERKAPAGPTMGTLIDFSEEPEETKVDQSAALAQIKNANASRSPSAAELLGARKPPPPRPAKPAALRSTPSTGELKAKATQSVSREAASTTDKPPPPPPPPRKPVGQAADKPGPTHPLSQMCNSSQQAIASGSNTSQNTTAQSRDSSRTPGKSGDPPPPPLPRRRATPQNTVDSGPRRAQTFGSDTGIDLLPPPVTAQPLSFTPGRTGTWSGGDTPNGSPPLGPQTVNKKLELWRRRLARAHDELGQRGVQLYTWRRGSDVIAEAEGIVKNALERMERRKKGPTQLEREFRRDLGRQ